MAQIRLSRVSNKEESQSFVLEVIHFLSTIDDNYYAPTWKNLWKTALTLQLTFYDERHFVFRWRLIWCLEEDRCFKLTNPAYQEGEANYFMIIVWKLTLLLRLASLVWKSEEQRMELVSLHKTPIRWGLILNFVAFSSFIGCTLMAPGTGVQLQRTLLWSVWRWWREILSS